MAGSTTSTNLATSNAATMDSRDGGRNLSIKNGSRSRGVSPGARIKEVFTTGPKGKDSSPPKSPDRASVISSGSGNALQALFTKDKRNSMNLGRSSKASDSKESVASNLQSPSSSVRDLPIIVTAPNTPPTPIDQRQDLPKDPTLKTKAAGVAGTNPNSSVASSGSTIAHRRVRSDSGTLASSKLSNVMSAPLTPMAEERTPGARTPSQGSQAGGFFSSVFSAAQNAATSINFRRTLDDIPAPVYYASLLGLDQALHDLVNNEQLESTKIRALSPTSRSSVSKNINAQGGRYGNALQAASGRGHEKAVQTLLDKGADVNAQGGEYGNAPARLQKRHSVPILAISFPVADFESLFMMFSFRLLSGSRWKSR